MKGYRRLFRQTKSQKINQQICIPKKKKNVVRSLSDRKNDIRWDYGSLQRNQYQKYPPSWYLWQLFYIYKVKIIKITNEHILK